MAREASKSDEGLLRIQHLLNFGFSIEPSKSRAGPIRFIPPFFLFSSSSDDLLNELESTSTSTSTAKSSAQEDARKEAAQIVAQAQAEAARQREAAQKEAAQIVSKAQAEAQRILSEAHLEADRLKTDAQKSAPAPTLLAEAPKLKTLGRVDARERPTTLPLEITEEVHEMSLPEPIKKEEVEVTRAPSFPHILELTRGSPAPGQASSLPCQDCRPVCRSHPCCWSSCLLPLRRSAQVGWCFPETGWNPRSCSRLGFLRELCRGQAQLLEEPKEAIVEICCTKCE